MNSPLNRRDFLKLASAIPLAALANAFGRSLSAPGTLLVSSAPEQRSAPESARHNLILIVFDAMSALHLSLHGYRRKTTPNLERLAQRATVFHRHYAAGNFTTPSTASLFTGVYPWTHRAFSLGGLIAPSALPYGIFGLLKDSYHQAAFAQNIFADILLYQFEQYLEQHVDLDSFNLFGRTYYNHLFRKDPINGMASYDRFLFDRNGEQAAPFLSVVNDLSLNIQMNTYSRALADIHPHGLPQISSTNVVYLNEQVMSGVIGMLDALRTQNARTKPTFAYIHIMAPHEPYRPTSQFIDMFRDGWAPAPKKKHRLAPGGPVEELNERRRIYDEYIANIDAEFGRLLDHLEQSGLLEESYVIVTSDHGELFERGTAGHATPLVFEPIIRIPLLISAPGQRQRRDVQELTSNVDLLPTLLDISGLPIPDWCEGQCLPALGWEGGSPSNQVTRSLFVVEAKKNPSQAPLREATVAVIRESYKLIRYFGYPKLPKKYELYDLKNDPEEMDDLYPSHPMAQELRSELDQKVKDANQAYWES